MHYVIVLKVVATWYSRGAVATAYNCRLAIATLLLAECIQSEIGNAIRPRSEPASLPGNGTLFIRSR